jgi:hypothetical protein
MITGCWANVNPPGSYHPTHNHPNNFLSGVYYVDIPGKWHGPRLPGSEADLDHAVERQAHAA